MLKTFTGVATELKNLLASICGTDQSLSSRMEPLEGRTLMAVSVINAINDTAVQPGAAATVLTLAGRYDNTDLNGSIVKFATDLGDINVLMYDQANPGVARTTPLTVANFLRYMSASRYNDTIFHRSVSNFVIQGGGFTRPATNGATPPSVTTFSAVNNEPGNSNLRGTIAMAKLGGNPNSATSQWFFNLGNNSANLDNQNGGFTVFGRVIKGLDVMDAIAATPVWRLDNGTFTETPLRNHIINTVPNRAEYVGMNISTVSELTYSVVSSNSGVVNATLSDGNLTLSYGAAGVATVTLRVTCADGTFIDDVFTVRVNTPPFLAGLNPSSANVGRNSIFTLSLGTATDDGGIARIDFYRDTNSNGLLDVGTDTLIGSDTSSEGGWLLASNTNDFALGTQQYFARATDTDGTTSATVTTTITVVNAAPVVTTLAASPNPAEGRVPVTLVATATDPDGTVAFVRFYLDSNSNGTLDVSTDTLLGEDTNGGDGYAVTVDTSTINYGAVRYFAAATDVEAQSGSATTIVGIINAPFSVGLLVATPQSVFRGQQTVLTASEIFIPAGKRFKTLEFYADSNANGIFDVGIDRKIAAGALKNGAVTAKVSTKGLAEGNVKYFARVQDNLLAWSPAKEVTVEVLNNTPTVRSMKVSAAVVKNLGDSVTLTVSSPKDVDGTIASVRYFRDGSETAVPDGIFDAERDTLLGTSTTSSGGFKFLTGTGAFSTGLNRFFAVVVDNSGAESVSVSATTRINAAPTLTTFAVTPDAGTVLGTTFTFNASGVGDTDGTIKSVEFFLDSNGSGVLDARGDKLLGKGKLVAGVWTLTLGPKKLPAGAITVFARVTDNLGGFSNIGSFQLTLT